MAGVGQDAGIFFEKDVISCNQRGTPRILPLLNHESRKSFAQGAGVIPTINRDFPIKMPQGKWK